MYTFYTFKIELDIDVEPVLAGRSKITNGEKSFPQRYLVCLTDQVGKTN